MAVETTDDEGRKKLDVRITCRSFSRYYPSEVMLARVLVIVLCLSRAGIVLKWLSMIDYMIKSADFWIMGFLRLIMYCVFMKLRYLQK